MEGFVKLFPSSLTSFQYCFSQNCYIFDRYIFVMWTYFQKMYFTVLALPTPFTSSLQSNFFYLKPQLFFYHSMIIIDGLLNDHYWWKTKNFGLFIENLASWFLQIGETKTKLQWCHNFYSIILMFVWLYHFVFLSDQCFTSRS